MNWSPGEAISSVLCLTGESLKMEKELKKTKPSCPFLDSLLPSVS